MRSANIGFFCQFPGKEHSFSNSQFPRGVFCAQHIPERAGILRGRLGIKRPDLDARLLLLNGVPKKYIDIVNDLPVNFLPGEQNGGDRAPVLPVLKSISNLIHASGRCGPPTFVILPFQS
jgi:hypothetical protein